MCSSEPRSLISLLNAVKEQPAALTIAAKILGSLTIAIAPKQRKRWLILAVPGVQITDLCSLMPETDEINAQLTVITPPDTSITALRLFSGVRPTRASGLPTDPRV
jgi:hypothetical protein